MAVNLNEGVPLGRTAQEQHRDQQHDETMKAMQMIATQCYNTCEAVKNFSNMVYDMLDAQGIIKEIEHKRSVENEVAAKVKSKKSGK